MATSIGKLSKSFFVKLLVGIIILPFVFWGMGDVFRGGNQNIIATIESKKISTQEFVAHLNRMNLSKEQLKNLPRTNLVDQILSEYIEQKSRLGKCMEWHFKLGGSSKVSGKTRKLKQEYTYLPTTRAYANIYKVYDMPPRDSFSAISESDEKMFNNMGEGFTEKPKVISGYYPLYTSKNYADSQGGGGSSNYYFNEKEYYMPSGLASGITYFHGDYDPQLLISYLGSQNFDYDAVTAEITISGQDSYAQTYTEQEEESTQEYSQQAVVQETGSQVSSGLFEGIYTPDTGNYAPNIGITDPDSIQEAANQTFLIDFFNENGGF